MASPHRSPLRDANHSPNPPPLLLPPPPAQKPPSPTPSPAPSPPRPAQPTQSVAVVNRANRDDSAVVTKQVEEGRGGDRDRGSRVVSGIVRRSKMDKLIGRAGVGVRISAAILSLISFSVMAADKTKGWAGDSFDRYKEYRFCITVNILAFVYSSFQVYAHVHHVIKGKHIIRGLAHYYFDLSLDQILAYLLLSASSAAATRNYDWVTNWGNDPFTVMINGSISMSFLAFVAFAISSLISAYNLFSWNI